MATAVGERLKSIKAHFKLSNRRLAEITGISGQGVADILKGTSKNPRNHIFVQLAEKLDLNLSWLLTGEGEMLKKTMNIEESMADYHTATRLPYLKMNVASVWAELAGIAAADISYPVARPVAEKYKQPCVLQMRGDNMDPELKHEDVLLITEVVTTDWSTMTSGLYVIVYKPEYVTIARIIDNTLLEAGKLVLYSDNPKYGKVTLYLDQIVAIWQVRRLIDREMY